MKFEYKQTARIKESVISKTAKQLQEYFDVLNEASDDSIYSSNEASLHLANDAHLRNQSIKLAKKVRSKKLQEIMAVSIGGSLLGTKAVYSALRPLNKKLIPISFYETVYSREIQAGVDRIHEIFRGGGEVLINLTSKSGTTNEPIANFPALIQAVKKHTSKWQEHVVVITEPDSKLDAWANEQGIVTLPNPENVGGRHSIFCPVGIFPLALSGIDVKKMHKGGSKMLKQCLNPDPKSNPALQFAAITYEHMQKQANMENVFIFNTDLENVGKWNRQMVAESLGKEKDLDGKIVNVGITPLVSIGTVDLHSTTQLFLSGPNDKLTTFMWCESKDDIKIQKLDETYDNLVPCLLNHSLNDVMYASYAGTMNAYKSRKLPYMEIVLEKQNEEELGAYLQFKMVATMLLGKLMHVNAFDQPNVEEYKVEIRKILE